MSRKYLKAINIILDESRLFSNKYIKVIKKIKKTTLFVLIDENVQYSILMRFF